MLCPVVKLLSSLSGNLVSPAPQTCSLSTIYIESLGPLGIFIWDSIKLRRIPNCTPELSRSQLLSIIAVAEDIHELKVCYVRII
jgi:hypothetical protein